METVKFFWFKINRPIFWLILFFCIFYYLFICDKPDWMLSGFPLFLFLSIYFLLKTRKKYLLQIQDLQNKYEKLMNENSELEQDLDYLSDNLNKEIEKYLPDKNIGALK